MYTLSLLLLNHGFKFRKSLRNSCHDFLMLYLNISDLTIKLLQFICWKILCLMIVGINKVHLKKISIKNGVCNYYFDNLMKAKNLKTKNILIDEKNYNNLVIYCARFVHRRSIKMWNLYYHESIGITEKHERRNVWWLIIISRIKY